MGFRFLLAKRHANPTDAGLDVPKLLVRNRTRGAAILADSADVAASSTARRKGLLGRHTLAAGEGLWIAPCESIHTCGMKFPIDVIYLDRKKESGKRGLQSLHGAFRCVSWPSRCWNFPLEPLIGQTPDRAINWS